MSKLQEINKKVEHHTINGLLTQFFKHTKKKPINHKKINILLQAIYKKEQEEIKNKTIKNWNEKTKYWVNKIKNGEWVFNSIW